MNDDERPPEQEPESPLQEEGFKEYVAQIDPGTATEMEALIEQLEAEGEQPLPPDARPPGEG
jgi:hypothetical protein